MIGLVVEAMRNIESRATGGPPIDRQPSASTWTSTPLATERDQAGHPFVPDVLFGNAAQLRKPVAENGMTESLPQSVGKLAAAGDYELWACRRSGPQPAFRAL